MSYFISNAVKMYPSSLRDDTVDRNAKLNSEQNITSITNRFTNNKSFIITAPSITATESKVTIGAGEFNLNGYYFKTTSNIAVDITNTTDKIYFYIKVSTSDVGNIYLMPLETGADKIDYNGAFVGLNVSTNVPTAESSGVTIYSLVVAQKINNVWSVPESSMFKFTSDVITYKNTQLTTSLENLPIDDGEWV